MTNAQYIKTESCSLNRSKLSIRFKNKKKFMNEMNSILDLPVS